jgi:hypothetical protein
MGFGVVVALFAFSFGIVAAFAFALLALLAFGDLLVLNALSPQDVDSLGMLG